MSADFLKGYRDNAQDFTLQVFNSPLDFTASGVAGNAIVSAGRVAVNFSGVAPVRVTLPLNYEKSNGAFTVMDTFGGAAGQNIIISGLDPLVRFNGATTFTINTAFGSANGQLFSGVQWIVK